MPRRDRGPLVIMAAWQYPPVYGGAGQQAQLLARELVNRGWRVMVYTNDQEGVGSERVGPLHVERVRGWNDRQNYWRVLNTVRLAGYCSLGVLRHRPRAIHVHGAYWWSIPITLLGRAIGSQVVVKLTRDGEDDPRTLASKRVMGLRVGSVYSLSLKAADHIIALNSSASQGVIDAGLQHKLIQLPNGIDVQVLQRTPERRASSLRRWQVPRGAKVAVFVGYLVKHKGVIDLLDAWRQMDRPDSWQLWFVGPTEGSYRELDPDVIAIAKNACAADPTIRLLGKQPWEAVRSILWAADVFVLPSHLEGMPNSLLEALPSGCTIVTTQIPGIQEWIDQTDAETVPPGSPRELATALKYALSRGLDSSVNVRLAMRSFSISSVADRIVGLYLSD
jgi:glycosyltransferase involved in cell wall biosynthesis